MFFESLIPLAIKYTITTHNARPIVDQAHKHDERR